MNLWMNFCKGINILLLKHLFFRNEKLRSMIGESLPLRERKNPDKIS